MEHPPRRRCCFRSPSATAAGVRVRRHFGPLGTLASTNTDTTIAPVSEAATTYTNERTHAMLSQKLLDALNDQLNAEYYSSYLYLAMAAYSEAVNLPGFANWFRQQTQEELFHAMKFFDYIASRGGRVKLAAIEEPPAEWDSPTAVFEATLAHEQHVTARINDLLELAGTEKDHATVAFLQWFINEQVEEEATADAILQKLRMAGDSPAGLMFLDNQLGSRQAATSEEA